MIKKILLLLFLGSLIGWIASCAWAPLQINVPVSWHDSHFKAEQLNSSSK